MTPAERLAEMEGVWTMRRVLMERSGAVHRTHGTALWRSPQASAPGVGAVLCREEGDTRLAAGDVVRASRATIWQAEARGIAVRFADDRPFHRIGIGTRPQARHPCPPDDYELIYDFSRWPRWSVRWRVRGPRKDYVAVSTYARSAPPDGRPPFRPLWARGTPL